MLINLGLFSCLMIGLNHGGPTNLYFVDIESRALSLSLTQSQKLWSQFIDFDLYHNRNQKSISYLF